MAKKDSEHYVDNKKFLVALLEYKKDLKENPKTARISEYIGDCFLRIAQHLSHKFKFASYQFREDMVSTGVENCVRYIDNFDPEISDNPFSYFTQTIYYAFVRTIKKEKKELYIKCLTLRNTLLSAEETAKAKNNYYNQISDEFIEQYEESRERKKKRKKNPVLVLDDFIADVKTEDFEEDEKNG